VNIPVNRHRVWQLAADAALVATAWWLAFTLRFDHGVPVFYQTLFERTILIVLAIKLIVFVLFGFYTRWWRYVSTRDMWGAARGVVVGCLIADVTVYFASPVHDLRLPRSVAVLDLLLTLAFVAGSRLLARTLIERPTAGLVAHGKEVIVVGAGDAGESIIRELLRNRSLGYTPIGLIDDDTKKRNMRMHGVRVLGTTDDLPHVIRDNKPDELLIAMPSAGGEARQKIVDVAREAGVQVKTLPGLYELFSDDDDPLAPQLRPVEVEDVLGREPVEVDLDAIASYLRDATVLVTGAGGSIGAELCRQIARVGAKRLILVDNSEPALFAVERELVDERGFTRAHPVIGDVQNRTKMRQVFDKFKPGVVFHTAAYKHVPMMEANPIESVRNNVIGTKIVADTAVEFGVARFVLISTDKALNPQAVYGQCKAICEWIVESYGAREDVPTRFVAVRFGNVLNSAGSVVPTFRRQIERGGPVTVTHPDMTRFFMTIPEAVALVVQAGAIGGRGEIFVLDMGQAISILELAQNMIRLSGKDVPITFVGARAGEKLHEELWGAGELVAETTHAKIKRASRPAIDASWLEDELVELERLVDEGDTLELVTRLATIVREPRRVDAAVLEDTLH
jgi:FlaA1/EpsC-like NDP-sugar epimerase